MSKPKLKPAPGYLLIEPLEKETQTAGGIYLPDTASEKPQKGKVVAIGPALKKGEDFEEKTYAELNDIVYYKKWGGTEMKIDGTDYLFVKFEDVLAVEG